MNKVIGILCFVLTILSGSAQTTYFNKMYDFDSGGEYGLNVLPHDSGYFVSAGGTDSIWVESLKYLIVDPIGNQITKKEFLFPSFFVRTGKTLQLNNNTYLDGRTIGFSDSSGIYHAWPMLALVNEYGDTLRTVQFKDSLIRYLTLYTFIQTPDSGVVLVCENKKGNQKAEPVLIRLNKNLEEQYRSVISSSGREVLFTITPSNDGGYLLGGFGNSGGGGFNPYILRVDSTLKFVWNRWYPSGGSGRAASITRMNDGTFVFGCDSFYEIKSGWDHVKKQLYRIDENGQIIWQKTHGPAGRSNYYATIKQLSDGNIVVLGREAPDTNAYYDHATLTKVDPHTGGIIWERRCVQWAYEANNYLWDFIETDDKGFILVGDDFGKDLPTQDVWLLKVDSNGCKPGCVILEGDTTNKPIDTVSVEQHEEAWKSVFIYPNPAENRLNIIISSKEHNSNSLSFRILDLNGQVWLSGLVYDSHAIDISEISSGMYFIEFRDHSSLLSKQKFIKK